MPARPAPFGLGHYRSRAIRGPREDGRHYWRVEKYVAGTGETKWTGWATKEEAERVVAELVRAGQVPATAEPALTVDRLLRRWVAAQEARPDLRPATIEACRQTGKRIARSTLAQVLCDRLDRLTLEHWRDAQLRAGRASRTLELDLGKLAQAWRWGREVGMLPARDLPGIRIVVRPVREDYTPTVGEVGEVVRELRRRAAERRAAAGAHHVRAAHLVEVGRLNVPHRRASKYAAGAAREAAEMESHALAVEVLAATGARRGELVGLRAGALTRRGEVLLLTLDGKTGRRVVPIAEPLAGRLEDFAGQHPDLWGRRAGAGLERILGVIAAELGQRHWTVQGLRRLAVDRLYSSGAEPGIAAAILGHSPAVALAHYRRASGDDLEAAIRAAGLGTLPAGEVIELASRRKA